MSNNPLANFKGYRLPSYTQIPDQLFDEQLHLLTHGELRVLLYIMRHTFGYKREGDHLAARQIAEGIKRRDGSHVDYGTGLSIRQVRTVVGSLEDKGLITIRREVGDNGTERNYYAVRLVEVQPGSEVDFTPPMKSASSPPLMPTSPPKKQQIQETRRQQQNLSTRANKKAVGNTHTESFVVAEAPTIPKDLLARIVSLGVHSTTAKAILRQQETAFVSRWVAYTEHKLASGWMPRESPAAWIVTAIRSGDWVIPDWFQTPEEQKAVAAQQVQLDKEEQRRQDEQADIERQRAEEQRRAVETELGIGERTRDTWERVKELLREKDQFSVAFYSSYLLPLNGRVATVAASVPFFCEVIEKHASDLRAVISEVSGKNIEAIEVRFIEPAATGD